MTWHLYLDPIAGTATYMDQRRAKYFSLLLINSTLHDYGFQPFCLVSADVDDGTDNSISANADVTRIPDNLDSNVAVNATKNALESMLIPADWINPGDTYRGILRIAKGMFDYLQQYATVTLNTLPLMDGTNVNLSTQFNQLPAGIRSGLVATANAMNIPTSGLSGTNTLRQILKQVSDSWAAGQFILGGITI